MPASLESSPELINELDFLLGNWDRLTDAERGFLVSCSKFLDRGYRVNKYMMAVRPNLYPKQQKFLGMNDLEVYTGGSGGGGKALSLDTPLPTPSGWTTMGQVRVGDVVFGEDGKPCNVLAISPVMTGRTCYVVRFDDDSEIVADADHIWFTKTEKQRGQEVMRTDEWRSARRAARPSRSRGINRCPKPGGGVWPTKAAEKFGSVSTTEQILETLHCRPLSQRVAKNHSIDNAAELELPELSLPIHPYVLGSWLGDGSSYRPHFTIGDEELIKHLADCGVKLHKLGAKYAWGTEYNLLRPPLTSLNLIDNKHIPPVYLRASKEQRLHLLQGLLDTDGTATKDGKVQFCNCNENIARGAFELAASLGLKPTIKLKPSKLRGVECTPHWLVQITTDKPVFRLSRKLSRLTKKSRPTQRRRFIVSIEPVESVPVRCIAVDSASHLYLAGRAMIPTHNSDSLLLAALQFTDVPTYSAVVFRNTFKNLNRSGSIMDRCRDWLRDSDAHWDGNDYRFTFPSGAKIGFGYMESLKHADQHRSAEYSLLAWDEITEVPEECYRFLFSRLRRNKNGPAIPLRVRSASNPGGAHAGWVKSRFIPPEYLACKDNDYRFSRAWEVSDPCGDCGGTGKLDDIECLYCDGLGKQVRVFLPSRVQDNPALDANEYRKSLSRMTWIERMQVEHGDWDITAEGGVFRMAWLRYYSIQGEYLRLTRFDEHNRPLPDVIVSRREAMVFVTADTATKAKTSADYSVIATWLFHRATGSLALLDVIRKKVDTPDLLPLLSGACLQAKAKFVLIEEASSGTELIQLLRKNNACIGGIPVKSYLTGSLDKVARSAPAQLRMESGMIYFPAFETAWKAECVAELLSFPKSINDDFVDNVSMAAWYAENHNSIHIGGSNASNLPSEIGSGPLLSFPRSSLDQY